MVHRRAVITGTALGGALSALTGSVEAAGAQSSAQERLVQDRLVEEIARAVRSVRDEIERQYTFWEIAAVRDQYATRIALMSASTFDEGSLSTPSGHSPFRKAAVQRRATCSIVFCILRRP